MNTPKVLVPIRLPLKLVQKLEQSALGYNTSAPQLAKRIIETVIQEDLIAAILDEQD